MAKVHPSNLVINGLSGRLGNIVFRRVNGQTIVSRLPIRRKKADTTAQKEIKRKFKEAVLYARTIRSNKEVWQQYAAMGATQGKSAFNMAVSDFYSYPEVLALATDSYQGYPGDNIAVIMKTADLLKYVTLVIITPDGTILESGKATANKKAGEYNYKVHEHNFTMHGTIIQVDTVDYAGNASTTQYIIE